MLDVEVIDDPAAAMVALDPSGVGSFRSWLPRPPPRRWPRVSG